MLPCRSAAMPSGCGAPAGNVAKRSTSPRSQADASSDQSERQTNTPKTRRNKTDIRTPSSQRCGTELSPLVAYSQRVKRKGGRSRLLGTSANGQLLHRNKLRFIAPALVVLRHYHQSERRRLCPFPALHNRCGRGFARVDGQESASADRRGPRVELRRAGDRLHRAVQQIAALGVIRERLASLETRIRLGRAGPIGAKLREVYWQYCRGTVGRSEGKVVDAPVRRGRVQAEHEAAVVTIEGPRGELTEVEAHDQVIVNAVAVYIDIDVEFDGRRCRPAVVVVYCERHDLVGRERLHADRAHIV